MALEYADGFDLYANAIDGSHTADVAASGVSLRRRWTLTSASNIWTSTTLTRVVGSLPTGGALNIPLGSGILKTLSQQSRWIVGFGYYFQSGNINTAGGGIYEVLGGAQGNNIRLFQLKLNNDGTLSLYANVTLIGTSIIALVPNQFYYIEFDISFSGSTNIAVQADLWVNDLHRVSGSALTGVNQVSLASNSAKANVHSLSSGALTGGTGIFDDLYILNGGGIINNQRIGPLKIALVHPNGDVIKNFTPSAGTAHFSLVNETPEDQDTTYVSDSVVNDKDIYTWEPVPTFTGSIPGVQLSTCARKTDEGHSAVQAVVGATGGEAQSDSFFLGNDYRFYVYPTDLDPATNLPWTTTGFNAKDFGVKVV